MFYDGKEANVIYEIQKDTHEGSIMSCDWYSDGSKLVTCSADKTVKVWDAKTYKCLKTLKVKDKAGIDEMLLAVAIFEDTIYAISLNGYINQWSNVT